MSPAELTLLVAEHNRFNAPPEDANKPKLQGKGKHGHVSPFMTG